MGSQTERRVGVQYVDASDVPSNLQKHLVDEFAAQVAQWLNRPIGQPVGLAIERLGGSIEYRDTAESPDGGYVVVHGPGDFGIVLSTWTSARRDQFTLAHELGHYALHSGFGERSIFAARTGTGRSEWEANWFAAGFLMPAIEFRDAVGRIENDALLADKFGVSVPAVRIRKKALGIE